MGPDPADPFEAAFAVRAPERLREFNRAGILDAADVQVARMLGRLAGVEDQDVLLGVAMAVRAPRLGHVFVDLAAADATVVYESRLDGGEPLPAPAWPERSAWVAAIAGCESLVARVPENPTAAGVEGDARPLLLDGSRLYLSRYWHDERLLCTALSELAGRPLRQVDLAGLSGLLAARFPDPEDRLQRAAVAAATLRGLTVIAGGPGTGKTTTVAALVEVLCEQAAAQRQPTPLIGLCAPTGKAAARLTEAIAARAQALPDDDPARRSLDTLAASTIHRLLGWLPGGRFRHNRSNRLPHDVVIVDETSMVPLSLMVRLVQAVRRDAQLILVGDPDQLTAIEAGAVLRDIVGPAATATSFGAAFGPVLERATGDSWPAAADRPAADGPARSFGDGVVVLRRGHRYGAGIGALADAIRSGDGDAAVAAAAATEVVWYRLPESGELDPNGAPGLRDAALGAYGSVIAAARAGDAETALSTLDDFRLLCAHRRGPYGVSWWTGWIERLLAAAIAGFEPSGHGYPGRPLLITENDHELRLNNGDTGVIVDGLGAVFQRDGAPISFAPSRLGAVETLYAMTVHKSQGSQFGVAAFVLPEPDSRILTRELLYTAVTRARERLILVGSEESLRAAVARPVARATGLRELLWEPDR